VYKKQVSAASRAAPTSTAYPPKLYFGHVHADHFPHAPGHYIYHCHHVNTARFAIVKLTFRRGPRCGKRVYANELNLRDRGWPSDRHDCASARGSKRGLDSGLDSP
jgi:hypothetical protein